MWQTGHDFLSSEKIVLSKSNIASDAGALVVADVADVDATGSSGGDDAGALVGDVADVDATGSSGGDDAGCGIDDKLLGGS